MTSRGSAGQTNGALPQTKICQFKLVLLGDMAVGKSSLVLRFVKGQFDEFQETTIGGEGRSLPLAFSHQLVYECRCGNPVVLYVQLRSWLSQCVWTRPQ